MITNGSFENGWHDRGNSQIPIGFDMKWNVGHNNIDPAEWSLFQAGEARVLHTGDIPAEGPHHIAMPDGEYMAKVFAGRKSIWAEMWQMVTVDVAGVHEISLTVLPDLVAEYLPDGSKVYAPDPMSGRISLQVGESDTNWLHVQYGIWQQVSFELAIDSPGQYKVGFAMMSPHPLAGNNWFLDEFTMRRVEANDRMHIEIPPGRTVKAIEVIFND